MSIAIRVTIVNFLLVLIHLVFTFFTFIIIMEQDTQEVQGTQDVEVQDTQDIPDIPDMIVTLDRLDAILRLTQKEQEIELLDIFEKIKEIRDATTSTIFNTHEQILATGISPAALEAVEKELKMEKMINTKQTCQTMLAATLNLLLKAWGAEIILPLISYGKHNLLTNILSC